MTTATLTIGYADVPGFPAGSAVSNIVVAITNTTDTPPVASTQTVPAGTVTVTFPNVDPGSYAASVSAVDASGAVLGTPVTGTFAITAPATVTLTLPASVSAAQS